LAPRFVEERHVSMKRQGKKEKEKTVKKDVTKGGMED
jgi:hypothetical protein